jgi:Protein of unknown function (DUF3455)
MARQLSQTNLLRRFINMQKLNHIQLLTIIAATSVFVTSVASANVPANIKPANTEKLVMHLPAIGVQIYECRIANNVDGKPAQWTFVAPEADLFEQPNMRLVGKHDAGPHWTLLDGSKVAGKVASRADATNQGAIPSLLLSAKSVGGAGRLDKVTNIQRLNTVGGVAPTSGCTSADVGKQARIYYTADYYFFAPNSTY